MNPNDKQSGKKRLFFRRRHPQKQLKYIAMLPSLVTLLNGIFGFAAIGLAAQGPDHFAAAGVMVFLAMIADMLDGRLARMSQTTSSFGGQLDSLCDMLSFGAAPAFLCLKMLMVSMPFILSPSTELLGDFVERLIWLASAAYMCCAAVRLARFNVENVEDESAHMSFSGLPSPAAAGVLASMVILYQHLVSDPAKSTMMFQAGKWLLIHTMPFVTIALAILMVSRIRYPHVVNQYLRGKKPINHLIGAGTLIGLIWLCKPQMAMVVVFAGFAASGPVKWLWHRFFAHSLKQKPLMTAAEDTDDISEQTHRL